MLTKYADTLKRRGLDTCSSQILADVLESFPKAISVKQLAHNTGKTEKYIKKRPRRGAQYNLLPGGPDSGSPTTQRYLSFLRRVH